MSNTNAPYTSKAHFHIVAGPESQFVSSPIATLRKARNRLVAVKSPKHIVECSAATRADFCESVFDGSILRAKVVT